MLPDEPARPHYRYQAISEARGQPLSRARCQMLAKLARRRPGGAAKGEGKAGGGGESKREGNLLDALARPQIAFGDIDPALDDIVADRTAPAGAE